MNQTRDTDQDPTLYNAYFDCAKCVTGRGCIGARTVQWSWQGAWFCADQDPRCACCWWHEAPWLERTARSPNVLSDAHAKLFGLPELACIHVLSWAFFVVPNFVHKWPTHGPWQGAYCKWPTSFHGSPYFRTGGEVTGGLSWRMQQASAWLMWKFPYKVFEPWPLWFIKCHK